MEVALGVLGVAISIILLIWKWHSARRRVVSWPAVQKYTDEIAERLKSEEWIPEIMVSFPKGGLIVADLLGHRFDNEIDVVSIHTRRVRRGRGVDVIIRSSYVRFDAIVAKRILLIDDVISGRETMKTVKALLEEKSRDCEIRTAVLGSTKRSYFEPHYSCFNYNPDRDLFLPWSKLTL